MVELPNQPKVPRDSSQACITSSYFNFHIDQVVHEQQKLVQMANYNSVNSRYNRPFRGSSLTPRPSPILRDDVTGIGGPRQRYQATPSFQLALRAARRPASPA
mmetsp:Transcript_17986/g.30611  ORF Transcript_17986/g.30611 Transcript_17986/m.30611 type:complete len:103 (-) Transcript_17986:314-622(-)